MRLGVIGSRSFSNYDLLEESLNKIVSQCKIDVIISGGARGADSLAERYATRHGIETLIFKPDWSLGRGAAAIRNKKIVDNSDALIAFWDGKSRGTSMTIKMAESRNIKILKVMYV